jgi:hypothetical protein
MTRRSVPQRPARREVVFAYVDELCAAAGQSGNEFVEAELIPRCGIAREEVEVGPAADRAAAWRLQAVGQDKPTLRPVGDNTCGRDQERRDQVVLSAVAAD